MLALMGIDELVAAPATTYGLQRARAGSMARCVLGAAGRGARHLRRPSARRRAGRALLDSREARRAGGAAHASSNAAEGARVRNHVEQRRRIARCVRARQRGQPRAVGASVVAMALFCIERR
jgi:hypothetical protein